MQSDDLDHETEEGGDDRDSRSLEGGGHDVHG